MDTEERSEYINYGGSEDMNMDMIIILINPLIMIILFVIVLLVILYLNDSKCFDYFVPYKDWRR